MTPPTTLKTRVAIYTHGENKVFIENIVLGTLKKLIQLKIEETNTFSVSHFSVMPIFLSLPIISSKYF